MDDGSWWDRLWVTQLWRLHLHHVARHQRARHTVRSLRDALAWAHEYAEAQRVARLEAQARAEMAEAAAAELGVEQLERWLDGDGS